jgi:class 3 adenylate cyclase/S1-C subfamily serine protease
VIACPLCGHEASDDIATCPHCGAPLTPARRAEERRVVTTLFCDLVGFTALSERNDPEVVDALLRRYYSVTRRVVESYGGTVEKFIGDAVVAVFGVPTLHEDDPERAVRAGLRLVDEIDALPGIGGQPVEVRVGVNTGEALVRLDVDPASGEGFLTGDAVNVAARLQSAAPPMAVAVGDATHAATENVFAFDACHPVALKGKSQALQVWIATAPLARTGAELRSFTSSFVGREAELGRLEELLHRATETDRAALALIVGEPGIGKSRLLAEFARRLDDDSTVVTWRQGRCLPFGSNVTFWALSEIVRGYAGILESDGVARTEARLGAVLPEGPSRDPLRARLRPLLGLEAEEASRVENFAAWRAFLEMQAAQGPTVLVIEDLHWADDPMLAFLDDLAQNLGDVPLLLLATARQEVLELGGPGAGFVSVAERVALGPLSGDETGQLILTRLGAKSLPVSLQAALLERSGGNPLFAEELVRLLEDRDLLENRGGTVALKPGVELPMPDSIGALIAARLDLLAPDRKALLADASVVGRSFWAGAVAAVGGREPAQVLEGLIELVAKELVRPVRGSSIEGETEFLFVHALVGDVAYAQLTRADRAVKHAALARWLEERSRGSTEDMAEILAYHYGTALEMATSCGLDLEDELMEPTSRYLALAGGRAAPLDAAAAAKHFAHAERVADEANRPTRRWLLSRRTRRTLRRRAPLLVGAAAVIAVAAVAALAIWAFMPSKTPSPASAGVTGPKTLTDYQIAAKYGPSVVRITTESPVTADTRLRWKKVTVSGVVVSEDGLIFTSGRPFVNKAVPSWQPVFVTVEYFGEQGQYHKTKGVLVGVDPPADVCVIKVDTRGAKLHPVPLGDSEAVRNGDQVVTLNRELTMLARNAGRVSDCFYSTLDVPAGQRFLAAMRTSASLQQPATGGALIDSRGRLVGVMGDFYTDLQSPAYTGRDVAVAVNLCKEQVAASQKGNQAYASAWLGISYQLVTPVLGPALGVTGGRGALVETVVPGSPADKAGIVGGSRVKSIEGQQNVLGGDVILSVNGVAVRPSEDIPSILSQIKPGRTVSVRLLRGQSPVTLQVKLVANPLHIQTGG